MQFEELKKAIAHCRICEKESAHLLEKRENCLEKINALKRELDQKRIKMLSDRRGENKSEKESIVQLEDTLLLLQKELKEIDRILDQYGEEHAETIERLRFELITKIGERSPFALKEYTHIEAQLESTKEILSRLTSLRDHLEKFHSYLKEGVEVQHRKRGLLSFFFNRHPKVLLSQAIHHGAQEARKILKKVELIRETEMIHQKLPVFLKKFIEDAEKPWNSSLYEEKYLAYFQEFLALDLELEREIDLKRQEIVLQEKAIEEWIEKYS